VNNAYLAILLFSIAGMGIIDARYKLVFFLDYKSAAKSIAIVMTLLLAIDVIGINLDIFSTNPDYVTGIFIGSENLPLEEFFFLFLLCYFTLSINRIISSRLKNV